MSSKADARAERVALLSLVFRRIARKDASDYRCFSAARECVKISDRLSGYAVQFCNGDMTDATYESRTMRARDKLFDLVESSEGLGVTRIVWETHGDPRGYVLKFTHPDVSGNTFGGGPEYGV